jgi:hypothetical protein
MGLGWEVYGPVTGQGHRVPLLSFDHMSKPVRWVHISLEIIGGLTVVAGLGWLALWLVFLPFKNFAGGNCDDSEQQIIPSSDGRHTVKSFHRVCGAGTERPYSFFEVYISTGNPNKGYEYAPIVGLRNIAPHQASVVWDSPSQLSVYFPNSAGVDDAYAKTFGVNIVLHPQSTVETK